VAARMTLVGHRYGKLEVLGEAPRKANRHWYCRCDCGATTTVAHSNLRNGHTTSCGCQRAITTTSVKTIHGRSKTTEHNIWWGMIVRCTNPKVKKYDRYGGRGIKVCERWTSFEHFFEDMGYRPSAKHSVDRIDNNGDYEPSNCRWATPTEQAVNKQHYLGKEYTWAGKTQALVGWSKDLGMSCGVLRWRIMVQGWPLERAFTKPIQQHCRRKVQNAKARIQPSL
jgi:hypothetical protein